VYLPLSGRELFTGRTMGVDIETYRVRIGRHALRASRASRRRREKMAVYKPISTWDPWTCLTVKILVLTAVLTTSFACCTIFPMIMSSQCVRGFHCAFSGDGMPNSTISQAIVPSTTLSEYDYDLSQILVLAGDIETNPGPMSRAEFEDAVRGLRDDMREDMKKCVAEVATIKEEIRSVSVKLDRFEKAILELGSRITALEHESEESNFTLECLENKIQEMEDRIEDQERRERRDNVLIYDVPEADNESHEDSERKVIEVVNGVLPEHLSGYDVVRAHRLGKKTGNKPRPLIAKLSRTTKKLTILGARADFRTQGFGVSSDLTPRQRDMIRQARNDDKIGFFKNGKFHTKPRPSNYSTRDRPFTRSQTRHETDPA